MVKKQRSALQQTHSSGQLAQIHSIPSQDKENVHPSTVNSTLSNVNSESHQCNKYKEYQRQIHNDQWKLVHGQNANAALQDKLLIVELAQENIANEAKLLVSELGDAQERLTMTQSSLTSART
jgi:hypothetical protein